MKNILAVILILTFISFGFAYAEDCNKCPSKSGCSKAKAEKAKEIKVYVSKTKSEKLYHKKNGCIIKEPLPITLKKAEAKKYKPCPKCFPKTEPVKKTKPEAKNT